MTLFNNLTRKNSKKVRTMMVADENTGGETSAGGSVPDMHSTIVEIPEAESWTYRGSNDHGGNFGFHVDENPSGLQLSSDTFFIPPPAPPTSGRSHDNNTNPGSSPIQVVKGFLESSLPFILLLVVKISFDHRTGIMLFLAMYGTFIHCNGKAVELMLPTKIRLTKSFYKESIILIVIIIISISLLYYTFADQKLYKSLYLVIPDIQPVDLWGMLWIVGATDFVVKFATVVVKLLMAFVPLNVLCRRKRGQCYQVIEVLSQFYRSIVPMTPWLYFLLDRKDYERGYWLSLLLLTAYVVCKSLDLYRRSKDVYSTLVFLIHGSVIGVNPSKSQMESIGSCCPICHDIFSQPIMLTCTHVFCEECITAWFDRERTCPMCRSKVQQAPRWRDGRTSESIQFF